MAEGEQQMPLVQTTPAKSSLSEDHIEDYSETEEAHLGAPLPLLRTPPGVAGRFASYLGAKGSGQKEEADAEGPGREIASSGDLISTVTTDDARTASAGTERKQPRTIPDALPMKLQERLEQAAASEEGPQSDAQMPESISADTQGDTMAASPEALHAAGHASEAVAAELNVSPPAKLPGAADATLQPQCEEDMGHSHQSVGTAAAAPAAEAEAAGPLPGDAESEASDCEVDGLPNIPMPGADVEDLLEEEPWMSRPAAERDLWERVRPRALRREAAQVQSLRFPASALGRIMKLHPTLGTRTSEALEVVNHATVLLLQALARAAAKSRPPGQIVQFQDIRQTCLNASELQFVLPANGTLDASALTMRSDALGSGGGGDGAADEGIGGATAAPPTPAAVKRGRRPGSSGEGPIQGQSMLNASIFARHAASVTAEPSATIAAKQMADAEAGNEADDMDEAGSKVVESRAEATHEKDSTTAESKAEDMHDDTSTALEARAEEAAAVGASAEDVEDAAEYTPEKPGQKRKAPASSKKETSKAPRAGSSGRKSRAPASAARQARSSGGAAPASGGGGIADFFRRSS